MKRASYREGIEIIAENDEPGCFDVEEIRGFTTVQLLAGLFDVASERVATDIVRYRRKHHPDWEDK